MSYDVIVIGSGIGGLTTAGLLARAPANELLSWSDTRNRAA